MPCTNFQIRSIEQISIRTPVGPITGIAQGTSPTELDAIRAVSAQLSALLAPFLAIFQLVETAQLIFETIATIPRAIASFSPGKIASKLSELRGKVTSLAKLLPQTSALVLAADVVNLVRRNLLAIRAELVKLQLADGQRQDVADLSVQLESEGEVSASARLDAVVSCQTQLIEDRVSAISAANAGIDQMIATVNSLIRLIPGGLPEIPTLGTLPTDLDAAIKLIDDTLVLLQPVSRAFSAV